ncbi:MAG: tripartite-type tricarboxylate transporter receptor subunit TctC [Rhodoferax sp.]|jgi:tripartite-type tricarboxylate transporter receptor subunit TctC
MLRRTALGLALSSLAGLSFAQQAPAAPTWPIRTVRIVVGFPAGSSPDTTARLFAEPLAKALGQPVIVENRVGAGGNIAADYVAKATDNHTLGLMINGNLTIAKLINPKINFDPLKDFSPISLIGVSPLVLTAPIASAGATSLDFMAAARLAGDQWSYGSPGVGTVGHIGMELLKSQAKINPVHVPYPGYTQVANAMLGGQLQLSLLPPALALVQIKAGKLRAIGVTSSGRSTLAPDIPSLTEAGLMGLNLEIWNAVAAPKSMPPAIINQLAGLFSEIARTPEMRQKMFQQGWQVVGTTAEGLAKRIQNDTLLLGNVISQQGITAN